MYTFKRRQTNLSLNSYRQATAVSFTLSIALEMCFVIVGNTEDLQTLVACLGFNSHLISSSTYIGRAVDLASESEQERKTRRLEFILTPLGIVLGLIAGITLSVIQYTAKHTTMTFIGITNAIIFTMRAIGSFAGIGNRMGSLKERPTLEKKALVLASFIGLGIGTVLFLTHSIPIICVAGINMFFQGSAALPTLISFLIAVGYITSIYQSAADYTSKAIRFFKAVYNNTLQNRDTDNMQISTRLFEYAGSFTLGAIGLIISFCIVPHIIVGWASLAAVPTVMITCINVLGGIGSRLGRLTDAFFEFEYVNDEKNILPTPLPTSTVTIKTNLSLNRRSLSNTPPITVPPSSIEEETYSSSTASPRLFNQWCSWLSSWGRSKAPLIPPVSHSPRHTFST